MLSLQLATGLRVSQEAWVPGCLAQGLGTFSISFWSSGFGCLFNDSGSELLGTAVLKSRASSVRDNGGRLACRTDRKDDSSAFNTEAFVT